MPGPRCSPQVTASIRRRTGGWPPSPTGEGGRRGGFWLPLDKRLSLRHGRTVSGDPRRSRRCLGTNTLPRGATPVGKRCAWRTGGVRTGGAVPEGKRRPGGTLGLQCPGDPSGTQRPALRRAAPGGVTWSRPPPPRRPSPQARPPRAPPRFCDWQPQAAPLVGSGECASTRAAAGAGPRASSCAAGPSLRCLVLHPRVPGDPPWSCAVEVPLEAAVHLRGLIELI